MWQTGFVELPDGRRVRCRPLRAVDAGPPPQLSVYLAARDPGPRPWETRWVRWPDFRTPASTPDAVAALLEAHARAASERVEIACRGGVGRTGTAVALLAVMSGVPAAEAVAWARVHHHPRAAETPGQRRWVLRAAALVQTPWRGGATRGYAGAVTENTTAFDDGASTTGEEEREILTWSDFGEAARELARQVVRSGWVPDIVIAVARGGLVPAGAVAYALGTKAMGTLNVEFYTGVAETLPEPVVLPPFMDTSELSGHKVLVVDDVADSGKTLDLVMNLIRTKGLPADLDGDGVAQEALPVEARSAVVYAKPRSVIDPDYVWRRTDRWIMFPWSSEPPVTEDAEFAGR